MKLLRGYVSKSSAVLNRLTITQLASLGRGPRCVAHPINLVLQQGNNDIINEKSNDSAAVRMRIIRIIYRMRIANTMR